jgi:hypothetical protein
MAGIGGFATTLKGSVSFTSNVLEIVKIDLPEVSVTDIDVSSMDSTSNFMEFIGGSIDPGVIDIEVNYDAVHEAAVEDAILLANESWTITFPDGATWVTDGYINKMGAGTAGTNEKIGRVMSIKCSGIPVYTPPA